MTIPDRGMITNGVGGGGGYTEGNKKREKSCLTKD